MTLINTRKNTFSQRFRKAIYSNKAFSLGREGFIAATIDLLSIIVDFIKNHPSLTVEHSIGKAKAPVGLTKTVCDYIIYNK